MALLGEEGQGVRRDRPLRMGSRSSSSSERLADVVEVQGAPLVFLGQARGGAVWVRMARGPHQVIAPTNSLTNRISPCSNVNATDMLGRPSSLGRSDAGRPKVCRHARCCHSPHRRTAGQGLGARQRHHQDGRVQPRGDRGRVDRRRHRSGGRCAVPGPRQAQ